jgi:hypothetical protein
VEITLLMLERNVTMETNNTEMVAHPFAHLNVETERSMVENNATLEPLSTTKDSPTDADLDVSSILVETELKIPTNNAITVLETQTLPEMPAERTAKTPSVVMVLSITENSVIPSMILTVHPTVQSLFPTVEMEESIPESNVMLEVPTPMLQLDADLIVLHHFVVTESVIPVL